MKTNFNLLSEELQKSLPAKAQDKALNLSQLAEITQPPKVFTPGDINFWCDEYISSHVLHAHLDPDTDDASRRPETIGKTVNAILEEAPPEEFPRLLDLGCGPGLYTQEFAVSGYKVTGIDFSLPSIEYAEETAKELGLAIKYRCSDYKSLDEENRYDIITLIYGDFCVLTPEDRELLLQKIKKALRPGGLFIFDVFTQSYPSKEKEEWHVVAEEGFWCAEPHLVLKQVHHYPYEQTMLVRYVIITEDGTIRTNNIWHSYFTRSSITSFMESNGFTVSKVWGSLTGEAFTEKSLWIGLVCRVGKELE